MALCLALAILLPGCATSPNEATMSASERRLKNDTERFNDTVLTGAAAGAVLGAVIGAVADSHNRGQGALIGAGAGGLAGAGAGYYIAKRNENAGNTEHALNERIDAAQREVQNYREIAAAAQSVADENRRKLADLKQRYKAGQISTAQYKEQAQNARFAQERINKALENARTVSAGLREDIAASSGSKRQAFERSSDEMSRLQQSLAQSQVTLAQALAGVPES